MTLLLSAQLETLRAALDRIIPEDEFPGALSAGTDVYVVSQLAGSCASEAPTVAAGLTRLDAIASAHYAGARFAALPGPQQDVILTELDKSEDPFFTRLVALAHEGFYADPANGGNRNGVSWRMVGYTPAIPPTPVHPSSPPS